MSEERTTLSSLRAMAMASGGYHNADTLHNVWLDFGYPQGLQFQNYWNMYRRSGIARNVIESVPDLCWSSPPIVKGLGSDFDQLVDDLNLWQRIRGVDVRQRVGRYAGLFMRVRDEMAPDKPVESGELIDIIPLYESQLKVIDSDDDVTSDTYGQPIMLQYNMAAVGSRNEEATSNINIHASRVVFAAEGADDGWIYGIPALEPVYNTLMDVIKIMGGGAEGFYKNASQSVLFDIKDTANASISPEKLDKFNENYDEFSKSRFRRALWTPGMEPKILESHLISPKEFFNACLTDIAAGSGIPASVLERQQVGRQAGDQDTDRFKGACQSRRLGFLNGLISSVIGWMVANGSIKPAQYKIVWDDLLARSRSQKLESSRVMSEINKNQYASGGDMPFTGEEIRSAGGFDEEAR